jgi:pimeloyl-ACP methyl ester carboxylesterase
VQLLGPRLAPLTLDPAQGCWRGTIIKHRPAPGQDLTSALQHEPRVVRIMTELEGEQRTRGLLAGLEHEDRLPLWAERLVCVLLCYCFRNEKSMKKYCVSEFVVMTLALTSAIIFCDLCRAAGPSATAIPSLELFKLDETLRQAGASATELAKFELWARERSPADFAWLENYIRESPSSFVRSLRRELKDEGAPAPPAIFPKAGPVMTCDALHSLSIPDTTIDLTTVAASDGSCRVTATVIHPPADNHIKVFIALPTKVWNGRFMGTGGSGYAGGSIDSLDMPATKGYAVGATDTGNEKGTASVALNAHGKPAWQRMRDNAYIGIHDMTVVGKALTTAFYDKAPRYAYFFGGSTGGRQALTEAQRYPKDYDGVLALSPALARDRYVPAQLWPQVVMHEANNFLSREKREAATTAAVKACDGADGVVDGVIDDPMRCLYDPAALVGTKVGQSTFTATDARIIREIWEGPKAHDGGFLWWGPTPGTDLSTLADTGGIPLMGRPSEEGLDWFRYFLVLDPKWDWKTLTRGEFELLFQQSIQEHASVYGGDDPNLTDFRDRGGKLLVVHGFADNVVPPQATIAYYNNVLQRMGGPHESVGFIRLFLVPGADHVYATPVPTPSFGAVFEALRQWVEQGSAPGSLLAELIGDDGKLVRTRPLFPYPQVTR